MSTVWKSGTPQRVQSSGSVIVPMWIFGTVALEHDISSESGVTATIDESASASDSSSAVKTSTASVVETCSPSESQLSSVQTSSLTTETGTATDESSSIISSLSAIDENANAISIQTCISISNKSIEEMASADSIQFATVDAIASITESAYPADICDAIVSNDGETIIESADATDNCSAVAIRFVAVVDTLAPTDTIGISVTYLVGIDEIADATDYFDIEDSVYFETRLQDALFDWLQPIADLWQESRDEGGTPRADDQPMLVWNLQNMPRPTLPILEGRISAITKIGRDVVSSPDHSGTVTILGTREFMLYLQCFGGSALDLMCRVRDACEDPDRLDVLYAAGITPVEASEPLDVSAYLDTMPEDRASMDIRFRTTVSRTTNSGMPIEEVLAGGTIFTGDVDDTLELDINET